MTTTVLRNHDWVKIRPQIDADYGRLTTLISWRCWTTLGFTVRHHHGFNPINGHFDNDIRLDFVSNSAAVFFRLKYL